MLAPGPTLPPSSAAAAAAAAASISSGRWLDLRVFVYLFAYDLLFIYSHLFYFILF